VSNTVLQQEEQNRQGNGALPIKLFHPLCSLSAAVMGARDSR
jgi:hypothetical protein